MSETSASVVGLLPADVVRVRGADRVDLLNRLSTNDLARLGVPGAAVPTIFTSEKGRVVDWVTVLVREGELLLRCSPGRAAGVLAWIDKYTIMEDVTAADATAELAQVVVQGAVTAGLPDPGPGRFVEHAGGLVVRGLAAYGTRREALVPPGGAELVIASAVAAGATRVEASAFERLRLEAGVPSPEHEFREEVNPLELRLGGVAVATGKGCYIGQEVLTRIDSYDKLMRVLVGFECETALDPAASFKLTREGRSLGRVTSAVDVGGRTIGLAIVKREESGPGPATLVGPDGELAASVVDRPFWKS
jgi:folate-binding protein YgfZ